MRYACVVLIDNMRLLNPVLAILSLGFGNRCGVTIGTGHDGSILGRSLRGKNIIVGGCK